MPLTELPLSEAAQYLGIRTETLRMRYKRGKVEGHKKDGKLYIHITHTEPTQVNPQSEQVSDKEFTPFEIISEQQRIEINRLAEDKEDLKRRLDRMEENHRETLEMVKASQVLQQQQMQQISALTARLALPAPSEPQPDVGVIRETAKAETKAEMERTMKPFFVELLTFLSRKSSP